MQTELNKTAIPSQNLRLNSFNKDSLKPISGWAVVRATIIKDIRVLNRYRPDLFGQLVELAIRALFFLFFANIFALLGTDQIGDLTGRDLFIFFQGGLLLVVFYNVAMRMPLRTVTEDYINGTLEYIYSNPCSRYAYYVGSIVAQAIIVQIVFLPLFLVLVLASTAPAYNMLMVLLVCVLTLVTLSGMGILVGQLGVLWRRVGSLEALTALFFEFLAGAYFPVSAMPEFMQKIALIIPHTWAYDLIRYYSFDGEWQTILPVWQEWIILGLFAVFFIALSRLTIKRIERKAKESGLHLI